MNLLLWRHAEAEDGAPDLARELTSKGRQQAQAVGLWLNRHFPKQGGILVSPAQRTRQTADTLAREYRIENSIAPGAGLSDILNAAGLNNNGYPLLQNDDDKASLLLVGHQPWIGAAACLLLTGQNDDWSVRKAAMWWLVCRQRHDQAEWTLRTVIDPDLV